MFNKIICLATSFSFLLSSSFAYAENNFFEIKEPPRAAEYIYRSSQKETLIGVQLLGAVQKPGLYYIPANTDILKLLTLAGGIEEANLSEVIVRKIDPSQAGVFELDMNKFMKSSADSKPFKLTQDDLIFIPKKEPWISNDVSRSITLVSLITSIVLTAVLIEKNTNK
ncbi:MAG: SLBB domain-containing protein [Pseudobdellovibrio sp.]